MKKRMFNIGFCMLVLAGLMTGCDNNRRNSASTSGVSNDSYKNENVSTSMTTGGIKPSHDAIPVDESPGNLTSTDGYRSTGSIATTSGATTRSTSADPDHNKFPDKDGDGNILNRDGDGKLLEKDGEKIWDLNKKKKQRSPESKNTTTGSSEDLDETTHDRSTH